MLRPPKLPTSSEAPKEQSNERTTSCPSTAPDIENHHRLKILIGDDDYYAALPLQHALNSLGCHVEISLGGESTINRLKKDHFDLLILDWIMPDLAGHETIETICNHWIQTNSDIVLPIITFSSLPTHTLNLPDTEKIDYLAHWKKPIKYPQLLDQSKTMLHQLYFEEES